MTTATTPFTVTRRSTGRAYSQHIKGVHKLLGYVDFPSTGPTLDALLTHPLVSHSIVVADSWIKATSYGSRKGKSTGVLIIWCQSSTERAARVTKAGTFEVDHKASDTPTLRGMVYCDVPAWKVGALHGFETIDRVREFTSAELMSIWQGAIEK